MVSACLRLGGLGLVAVVHVVEDRGQLDPGPHAQRDEQQDDQVREEPDGAHVVAHVGLVQESRRQHVGRQEHDADLEDRFVPGARVVGDHEPRTPVHAGDQYQHFIHAHAPQSVVHIVVVDHLNPH